MWRRMILVVLMMLCVAGSVEAQGKEYRAQRFDVDVAVQGDGSLLVTETVTFDFEGGPFTFVFRELETERTDGIVEIEAQVDGQPVARGERPGQVEISGGDPVRVEWHLEPFSNATRTFVLSYRMLGVVRQEEGADLLVYQPLPDEYEYRIGSSTVAFRYPARAEIGGDVRVTTGNAAVQQFENEVIFTARDLGPDDTLVVEIPFAPDSLISAPPEWQQRQMAQRETAPLWIGAAVGLFVVGIVVLAAIYRRHQPPAKRAPKLVFEPPSELPPAMAGAIHGSSVEAAWPHALATLFDLADRGVLQIEELREKTWWRGAEFLISRLDKGVELRPHERGLLEALFETKEGATDEVKLSEVSKRLSSKQWKRFSEPLKAELKAAGFVSERRGRARGLLIGAGVLLLFVGLGFFIVAAGVENVWIIAPAASLALLGLIVAIAGTNLSALSDAGAREAAVWGRFAEHLKNVTKGKATIAGPAMFQRFLPYAAAYGILQPWAKWFEKEGWTELPHYFQTLSHGDTSSVTAFLAMVAATNSAGGGAAGGAGGAGAAGGGASGAG